jgi:hypothetical protein
MAFINANRGMGTYKNVGDWTWEFYPGPYSFLAPSDSAPQPAPILYAKRGMSGCGCGCNGAPGGCGGGGVGDWSSDFAALQAGSLQPLMTDITATLTGSWIAGIPNWALLLGGVAAVGLVKGLGSGGGSRRRGRYS